MGRWEGKLQQFEKAAAAAEVRSDLVSCGHGAARAALEQPEGRRRALWSGRI